METTIITNIVYELLVNGTASFILIFLTFIGAYWLYNQTVKTNAEIEITNIGKEISLVLSNKISHSPAGGISYSDIDKIIEKSEYDNRDEAIHNVLKRVLHEWDREKYYPSLSKKKAARLIVSIVTERYNQLTPYGIKLSGRGIAFSPYGEEVKAEDTLFPFGTYMYKKWVRTYNYIYQDLWMATFKFNRRHYVQDYPEHDNYYNSDYVDLWLDQIEQQLNAVHKLFQKLTSYFQILEKHDNQFNLNTKYRDCLILTFFLSISGYLLPKILNEITLLDTGNTIILSLVSIVIIFLIVKIFFTTSKIKSDIDLTRNIELSKLLRPLQSLSKRHFHYKSIHLRHIISLKNDLKITPPVIELIYDCVRLIGKYNQITSKISIIGEEPFNKFLSKYETTSRSGSTLSLDILDLYDPDYNFDNFSQLLSMDGKDFTISCNSQDSFRNLLEINLAELSSNDRISLAQDLYILRNNKEILNLYVKSKTIRKEINSTISKLVRIFSRYNRNY